MELREESQLEQENIIAVVVVVVVVVVIRGIDVTFCR